MGFGLELLLTKLDIISSKLQSVEDNLKSMEDKMQKSEIKMLQKVEDEIQEHRSSQTKNHKETFAAIQKLEHQVARNLSEVHIRNQENINTTLQKLDKDIERVLQNQYSLPYPTSCKGVPSKVSGTYLLRVKSGSATFKVFCEQEKFGGEWIVMQFRYDGSLDFYRGWNEFRDGFGDLNKEFWLGLEKVHQITSGRKHELIVELKDFSGNYKYARYDAFEISGESDQYRLKGLGNYSGTAEFHEFRSSQDKSQKEMFTAIEKLEHQVAHNLSEVNNRNQEHINAVLHKLDRNIGSVLQNQYSLPYPTSCKGVPSKVSGTYLLRVKNDSVPFKVYCEQNAIDGGWIVMQFRFDGSLDFYRDWKEFRDGFGDLNKEFWLGLEKVHQITNGRKHELIVELKDYEGTYAFARYDAFEIGSESERYTLKDLGTYNGTAGDAMSYNMGRKFSTKDRDNDDYSGHCAQLYQGAWWYKGCAWSNLNGRYINANDSKSMFWHYFNNNKQGLSYSRMMIRELE
ncbi:fibroleukin-like [Anopheles darlingi]|uniref:fibroleukin-like n=1 Tax=Anopheles darlingi TaxID=43151 RepID=UPI0021001E62|nr:fibroleukin-like [Anopheles darlingi]